jgi:protein-tyrosine phosphatase
MKQLTDNLYYCNLESTNKLTSNYIVSINKHALTDKYDKLIYYNMNKINKTYRFSLILSKIYKFLIDGIDKNKKIIIHCIDGIEFAPYICLALLCKYYNKTKDEAINMIFQNNNNINNIYIQDIEDWLRKNR